MHGTTVKKKNVMKPL